MHSRNYRPDIDGLRALAVVLVLLFHADLGFNGGYVGVDVFFVISGYLITRLILRDQASGTFSLKEFWIRRVRRIAPASLTMAVTVLLVGGFLLLPRDYEQLAESTIAHQLMFANFHFWKNTGYFDGPSEMMPLLHTWSLAVEEQFYLIYPVLLVAIGRFRQTSKLITLLLTFAFSFVWSVVGVHNDPSAAFYLLPTRAWELLLGGLICFFPTPVERAGRLEAMSWLGLGCIVFPSIYFDALTPFPGITAMLPCLGTASVIYANSLRQTTSGKLLAAKPLVFIGLISYSLYLWHWPVLAFARYWMGEELSPLIATLLIAISCVLAWLSWNFVETPLRRTVTTLPKKANVWSRRPIAVAVALAVVVAGAAQLIVEGDGLRSRFSSDVLTLLDGSKLPVRFYAARNAADDNFRPLGRDTGDSIDFLVWGDSHAMALGELFDRLGTKNQLRGFIAAAPGTLPLLETWRAGASSDREKTQEWNRMVLEIIRREQIPHIVLVGRWAAHVEGRPNGVLDTLLLDKYATGVTPNESKKVLQRGFAKTLSAIEQAGAKVWILGQVPLQHGDPIKRLVRAKLFQQTRGDTVKGIALSNHEERQANVLEVLDQLETAHSFIDPANSCFDETGRSLLSDGRNSFYCDNDHLSVHGAEALLAPLLEPIVAAFAAERTTKRLEKVRR